MNMFGSGFNDPFNRNFNRTPEPLNQRFKRFIKTQPLLAVLIVQAIILYIVISASFFYSFFFIILLYIGGVFLRHNHSDITLLSVYIAGGVSGYFVYPFMFNASLIADTALHKAAIQGSAAFALMTFTAIANPQSRLRVFLLMHIRFRTVAAIFIIIALLLKDIEGGGTHLSYLSGSAIAALIAFIFVRKIKANPFQTLKNKIHERKNRKFAKYETIQNSGRPLKDEEYNDIRAERQKRIDEILDKISKSGYDSLTQYEKELLFRHSK